MLLLLCLLHQPPQENQQIPRHPNTLAIYLNIYYFIVVAANIVVSFLDWHKLYYFQFCQNFQEKKNIINRQKFNIAPKYHRTISSLAFKQTIILFLKNPFGQLNNNFWKFDIIYRGLFWQGFKTLNLYIMRHFTKKIAKMKKK